MEQPQTTDLTSEFTGRKSVANPQETAPNTSESTTEEITNPGAGSGGNRHDCESVPSQIGTHVAPSAISAGSGQTTKRRIAWPGLALGLCVGIIIGAMPVVWAFGPGSVRVFGA